MRDSLGFCLKFRGYSGRDGEFLMDFDKGVLGCFRQFGVSLLACFCYRCWCVLSLWTKSPQQDLAGLSAQERGSTPLSLHKHLAENGPIVLNGRKRAFIDQTLGTARKGPLLWKGKDGERMRGRGLCCMSALCLQQYLSVHSVSFPNSLYSLLNHPHHNRASLWLKADG